MRRFSKRLFSRKSISKENTIPRSKFLSISASLAYGIPITSLTYGIISNNVYDYRVKRRVVSFDNLPKEFDGIRVCHISDIHVGSLRNRLAVKGGIDMILNENATIKSVAKLIKKYLKIVYISEEDAFKLADLLPSDGSNSFYKIWSKYT